MGVEATHTIMTAIMNSLKEKDTAQVQTLISDKNELKQQVATIKDEMNKKAMLARKEKAQAIASIRDEMTKAMTRAESNRCPWRRLTPQPIVTQPKRAA
jgi:hypothetical protein